MKKTLVLLSMLAAAGVQANDVTINLGGELAPLACTLGVTNGTVDLGQVSTLALDGGTHTVSWDAADAPRITITCNGEAPIAFSLTDNRAATLDPAFNNATSFGIGRFDGADPATAPSIGFMELTASVVSAENDGGAIADAGALWLIELGQPPVPQVAPELAKTINPGDIEYTFENVNPGATSLVMDLLGTLNFQDSSVIEEGFETVAHTIDGNFTVTAHF